MLLKVSGHKVYMEGKERHSNFMGILKVLKVLFGVLFQHQPERVDYDNVCSGCEPQTHLTFNQLI